MYKGCQKISNSLVGDEGLKILRYCFTPIQAHRFSYFTPLEPSFYCINHHV